MKRVFLMKKTISLVSGLLLLSACASTEDTTLNEIIFDDGELVEVREAVVSKEAPVKEVSVPQSDFMIVSEEPDRKSTRLNNQ